MATHEYLGEGGGCRRREITGQDSLGAYCGKRRDDPVHTKPSGHRIELTLDKDGVHATFHCDEPDDGWCHQTCALDCPTWDSDCMMGHPRTAVSYCNPLEFIENGGDWTEQYIGEKCEPRSGAVVFEWQPDEWYGWRYEGVSKSGHP